MKVRSFRLGVSLGRLAYGFKLVMMSSTPMTPRKRLASMRDEIKIREEEKSVRRGLQGYVKSE